MSTRSSLCAAFLPHASTLRVARQSDPCRCDRWVMRSNPVRTGVGVLTAAAALLLSAPRPTAPLRVPAAVAVDQAERAPLQLLGASRALALATAVETPETASADMPLDKQQFVVARRSIQDLDFSHAPAISESGLAAAANDGEFALSVRLLTAVALGCLAGSEPGASALNLGIRALTGTSLGACLASIYTILPPGAEAAQISRIVPPSLLSVAAVCITFVGLVLYAAIQPYTPLLRRRRLRRSAMAAAVMCSAAGAGAACAAGQALPAALFYLLALAVCRSTPLPIPRRRRLTRPARPLPVSTNKRRN